MVHQRHTGDSIRTAPDAPARHDPLSGFPAPPDWTQDAVCAETDPEAFFPEKGGSTREAKAMCARCTVAAECLDYALANKDRYGIYGGLSERERKRLFADIYTQPEPETDELDKPLEETA